MFEFALRVLCGIDHILVAVWKIKIRNKYHYKSRYSWNDCFPIQFKKKEFFLFSDIPACRTVATKIFTRDRAQGKIKKMKSAKNFQHLSLNSLFEPHSHSIWSCFYQDTTKFLWEHIWILEKHGATDPFAPPSLHCCLPVLTCLDCCKSVGRLWSPKSLMCSFQWK
jgi:hypothetical protein